VTNTHTHTHTHTHTQSSCAPPGWDSLDDINIKTCVFICLTKYIQLWTYTWNSLLSHYFNIITLSFYAYQL